MVVLVNSGLSQSDWPNLSEPLLEAVIEAHGHVQDNCAAACACKAWRAAISSFHIPTLSLHATSSSQAKLWGPFLSARSICQLALTGVSTVLKKRPTDDGRPFSVCSLEDCPLSSVPLQCDSLTVDEFFAATLHLFTDQPVQLKHLKSYVGTGYMTAPAALPSLNHLTRLHTLELLQVEGSTSSTLASILLCCPEQLHKLVVQCRRDSMYMIVMTLSPEVQCLLTAQLRSLRSLELTHGHVEMPQGSIMCLTNLTSLSFRDSVVLQEGLWDLLCLPNLVTFDLTKSEWQVNDSQMLLERFEGWSALRVLHTEGCSLFTPHTVMVNSHLQEMHTQHIIELCAGVPRIFLDKRVFQDVALALNPVIDPLWATALVHVSIQMHLHWCTNTFLANLIHQTLTHCSNLEGLHVLSGDDSSPDGADFVLVPECGKHLVELKVDGVRFQSLDLSCTSSLTSIRLTGLDTPDLPCHLRLPYTTQQLTLLGSALCHFTAPNGPFVGMDNLTKIVPGSGRALQGPDGVLIASHVHEGVSCVPKLPSSLRFLRIACRPFMPLMDKEPLSDCVRLERLVVTLPYESTPVAAWAKTMRHLRVDKLGQFDLI